MKAQTYLMKFENVFDSKGCIEHVITSTAETGIKTSLLKLEMDSS